MGARSPVSDRRRTVLLILILLLALVLRANKLDGQSLWSDEGNSAALAARSLPQIARDSARDIHPPLYYWILHIWTRLLGNGETALRSLSSMLGVLQVWFVYLLGWRLHDRRMGLLAAFLAAVAPFQVYYSQEARMYMLLAVCGTALMYGLVRIVQSQSTPGQRTATWYGYGAITFVSAVAGLYTHYSFPIVLAVANLLYVVWWIASLRAGGAASRLALWALPQMAAFLLFMPWLPTAVQRVTSWPGTTSPYGASEGLLLAIRTLAFGPSCSTRLDTLWLIPSGVLLMLALAWTRRRPEETCNSPVQPLASWFVWLIPVAWVAAPVVMMFVLNLVKDAYLKFLLVASAPLCILTARGFSALVPSPARLRTQAAGISRTCVSVVALCALVLSLVATALSLHRYYDDSSCARDDYRGIAQYVASVSTPDDAILLNAPGQLETWEYYDRSSLAVYAMPLQRPPDPVATISELESIAASHTTLFALLWATDESDPHQIIETWLDQHAFKANDTWQGNVRFVTYAFPQQGALQNVVITPNALFGDLIWLREVQVLNDYPEPGDIVQVSLAWEAEQPIAQRYKVTLQLLDDRSQVLAQRDAEPVGESRPTSTWPTHERIQDAHGLPIPLGTAPGNYRLIAALYDPTTGERLLLANDSDHLDLPSVAVVRPSAPPDPAVLPIRFRRSFDFGDVKLLGHDRYKRGFAHAPDILLHAGDLLHFTMFWQATDQPREDWSFTLRLRDQPVALSAPLVGDWYQTSQWHAGEIVRGEHDLQLPNDLRPGSYHLLVSLVSSDITAAEPADLGTIRVHESSARAAQ